MRSFSKRQSIKNYVESWKCKDCETLLPPRFELDHTIPLHWNLHRDLDRLDNLQALCPTCHSKKTFFDMQKYWDQKREEATGRSKYFDSECFSYIPPRASIS